MQKSSTHSVRFQDAKNPNESWRIQSSAGAITSAPESCDSSKLISCFLRCNGNVTFLIFPENGSQSFP